MERRRNGERNQRDWLAVDGEAEGNRYSILCDSDGRSIYKKNGLSTKECLEFLLSGSQTEMCCFGLTYDANNWLKDLNKETLWTLWRRQSCIWIVGSKEYHISWIPAKELTIAYLPPNPLDKPERIRIVECWGFFQTSFIKSCQLWNIDVPDEIVKMKEKRGTFTKAERERVTQYCLQECRMLAELMGKLQRQCERVGIVPRKWIGPGQLAAAMLEREGVEEHHRNDEDLAPDEQALEAIRCAYFGGRVELYAQGDFEQVYVYDINSAYPAGMVGLPSLAEPARLVHTPRYTPGLPFALWRCRWDSEKDLITPFPTRKKHDILYPKQGEGWYHACEVRAAICAGHQVEVLEGYVLKNYRRTKPFKWIPRMYEHRRKLKEEGDAGEKPLKLALNSLYGKLAQGVGGGNRLPRWQSYFWAGMITAWTRAKLMELMQRQTPLMIATDGIFFAKSLDISLSDELGDWSGSYLEGFFALKPGVYLGWDGWFEYVRKSRGFFAKEVDYNELRKQFQEGNTQSPFSAYAYKSRRFIGMGTALYRKDFSQWLEWREDTRQIRFAVDRRMPQEQPTLLEGPYLRPLPGPVVSEPYIPKGSIPVESEDYLQGLEQPKIGAML